MENCGWPGCDYKGTLDDLWQHQFVHQFKKKVCDYTNCGESFDNELLLRKHKEEKHNSDEEMSCQQSGCQFKTCVTYADKQKVIGFDNSFEPCVSEHPGCQYRNVDASNLTTQTKPHHGDQQTKLTCHWPECDYSTLISEELNQHIQSHIEEKPNECQHSGYGMKFSEKQVLAQDYTQRL